MQPKEVFIKDLYSYELIFNFHGFHESKHFAQVHVFVKLFHEIIKKL